MKTSSVLWAAGVPLVLMPTLQLATIPMGAMLSFFVAKRDCVSCRTRTATTSPTWGWVPSTAASSGSWRSRRSCTTSTIRPSTPRPQTPCSHGAGAPIKLGLPGVGDWKDNEKLWKAARLGGGKAAEQPVVCNGFVVLNFGLA